MKERSKTELTPGEYFLKCHLWLLAGYALMGRGLAYIGVKPLFIGDIMLITGILIVIFYYSNSLNKVLKILPAKLLLIFIILGAIRTVPYISIYKMNAFRDGAVWGYGFFAFVIASLLISKPAYLVFFINRFRKFIPLFLILFPFLGVFQNNMPFLPGSSTRIISIRPGEAGVIISGIFIFILSELINMKNFWFYILAFDIIYCLLSSRTATLAIIIPFLLFGFIRGFKKKVLYIIIVFSIVLLVLNFSGMLSEFDKNKFKSIFISVEESSEESVRTMEMSKRWRVMWWKVIINYTFYGEYFLTGKGFGINLADDDGFQTTRDHALRSPHNGHLTILARAGVPGFFLWILLQASWGWRILQNFYLSKSRGHIMWSKFFLFLLSFFLSFLVNASFDVYLEGPQGGIWFWSVFGIGIASSYIYKNFPQILEEN
ncbi:MAG: O-Antigen ligase [bacterium ADurb.Bin363]|nr:MAG: O-Antigen ligase [bacterium ADurb.Bin363]